MIPIKELTVGSWVYDGDKTQFPMYVCSVMHDGYVTLDFKGNEGMPWDSNANDLEGIPLTDSLMKELGFTFKDGLWRKKEKKREVIIGLSREFVFIEAFDNKYLDSRGWCHGIKYLHQVQNLFRCIAKEEFEIEL